MVFLLWEDIVEVKPKMLLVFIGSLFALSLGQAASRDRRLSRAASLHRPKSPVA